MKKSSKKILLILYIIILFFIVCIFNIIKSEKEIAIKQVEEGKIKAQLLTAPEGYTEITNVQQLKDIMSNDPAGKYILMADINLQGEAWTPIGTSSNKFTGTFDGNYHTISNLNIDSSDVYVGLFGYIEQATITNLILENANVKTINENGHAGGIIGYASDSNISNVSVTGSITGRNVGGIVGRIDKSTITDSHVEGSITGSNGYTAYVGGVTGYAVRSSINNSYAIASLSGTTTGGKICIGGLIGSFWDTTDTCTIKNCYTEGDIQLDYENAVIGGLVGDIAPSAIIEDSYSTCSVESKGTAGGLVGSAITGTTGGKIVIKNSYATGTVIGNGYVGGLIGNLRNYVINSVNITNCHATGDVTGAKLVGGLIGNNVNTNISNSYATGNVTGSDIYIGGLIGESSNNTTINNTYATGTVNGKGYVGGLIGYIYDKTTVNTSFAKGSVTATEGSVGGLVGHIQCNGTIKDTYAIGSVTGTSSAGGLIGRFVGTEEIKVTNSYAIGKLNSDDETLKFGGLIGRIDNSKYATVVNSYYIPELNKCDVSASGTAKTLQEQLYKEGYQSWDFANTWLIEPDGGSLAYLKWYGLHDEITREALLEAPYKVEHYIQNTDLSTYTLSETVDKIEGTQTPLTGKIGNEVTAVAKQYTGFRENETAEGRIASGVIVSDGSLTLKLYYDRETYNVTLNTNVGGVTGAQIAEGKEITNYTYGIGANLPTLTEVTKAFYVFRGWFEEETCEGTAVTKITETDMGAKTYYAKWLVDTDGDGIPDIEDDDTQVPYKIEHYKQKLDKTGYDLAETQTTIVVTNEETGAQETKILTGNLGHEVTAVPRNYTGFTENQTVTGRVPSGIVVVDGSLILKLYYDRNSYKLPLDVDGKKEEIDYVYGEEVTLPTNKEKPGYTFEGWYDNEDQAGEKVEKVDTNEIDPENPPTHYIKWTANTNTPYKVEHYLRTLDREVISYELIETQNLTGTTNTKAIAQPKTYIGCTENTQYEERKPEGNIAGDGSLVLKLYYDRNSYKLPLDVDGKKEEIDYVYGEEVTLPTNKEKPGYTFEGWYDNEDQAGEKVEKVDTNEIDPENPPTHYIKWTANTNTPYKVEHYLRTLDREVISYELIETQNLTGTTDTKAIAQPKTYIGCTENTQYEERKPEGNIAGDGSLVLKLYYDRNSYKLPLDVDGKKEEIDYVYGEEVTLPTDKEKPGYTFEGWHDNEEQTGEKVEKVDTNEIDPENPPTHYIKWTANTNTPYKVEHYLRTLDNEVVGYELVETQNLTGTTDTKATAQPKEYAGCTENTQYEERKPEGNIAGDGSLVLKLYYERNKYQINYELNGGTTRNPLNKSYTYGEEVILSNRIEKEGYMFAGWYENSECTGQAVTSIKETDVGGKTYYAKWVKEEDAPFTITSNKYKIEDETKYITKVSPSTNKETFMKNITTNGNMKVLNKQGSEIQNNDLVGTGYTLQVEYKGTIYEYIIGVRGDLDGNGKITATDLATLNQKLTNKIKLTGILEKSADIDFDGQITVTDLSTLNQALIKKVTL